MKELFKKRNVRKLISMILAAAIMFTSIGLENLTNVVEAATSYTTLYLVDDTPEHWLGNDNAVIEMIDNTYGHDRYIMTKENGTKWSVRVPSTTYNVTFNRLSPDKSTRWNSWSAGGRDNHSTYHAITHEHGYWDGTAVLEEGFHEGDVIYLDYYEFNDWKKSGAQFYVNFTGASKQENSGEDININSADKDIYSPIKLVNEIEEDVFTYTVTKEDEGAKELRFWRGNADTLWNCSVTLSYNDYKAGNNCAKIQGWNDTGYVCPYVPRRHITQIDSIELEVSGNKKVNRKIDIDLNIQGEVELLSQEETTITIEKVNRTNGEEGDDNSDEGSEPVIYDDTKTLWNHRELIFKEAGNYCITAVATDGVDIFTVEKYITIADDEAPVADFKLNEGEENIYLRDSNGIAHISVTDMSVSEIGDDITKRIYGLYYDANNNGEFEEEEFVSQIDEHIPEINFDLQSVGKYKITLYVQETFTDTIPELIRDSDYLSAETSKVFEIVNQAPESSMSLEKSRIADIIFTVGNADREILDKYVIAGEQVKEKLKELGIEANVSTVSTSALTAQDTFAWTEYDHYNYSDWYLPTIPQHIIYDGNDIKMVGYSRQPLKDFLYIDDNDSSRKVFEFDLQRDNTNWHSMEGGGFLFNTKVSEEENYIQGYCILVTSSGLRLVQINKVNLSSFRNGSYGNVHSAGRLLQTFPMQNLYEEHHFKIIIDKNILTVYDDDKLIINEYVLPEDGVEAYGYGPIISHLSHSCGQQSFFTFKNIVMQTITGESLSDVVNNHEWTPGTNHYVINLSDTSVPELSDNDRMSDVAAAMIHNDTMFFGIGNDNTIDQYNTLLNTLEGKGENIELLYEEDTDNEEEHYKATVEEAVNQIVSRIIADINYKDYTIGYTIATDEEVVYTGTYYDSENDPVGAEEWNYIYDASVFGESNTEVQRITRDVPITMFTQAGAYEVSHRVSDNPTGGNAALDSYIKWSDTDGYKKLILSQHRPTATVTATVTQSPTDNSKCMVNVIYEGEDIDHPSDSRKGIRDEKFYYKELGEDQWIEGRFPAEVEMGTTYLVKYIVTDIEGTESRPAMAAIKTSEARVYVQPDDTNPPVIDLSVSSSTVEVGETFYIEASAADDYGITDFSIHVNGEKLGSTYGRYDFAAEDAGEIVVTVTATDIGQNTSTETKTVTVIDKSDVMPPDITITSPSNGAISGKTDIIGSITDNKQLKSYTVTCSYVRTGTEENESGDTDLTTPHIIASGTEEIHNDVIATIDTDILINGVYKIDITAEDMAGLTSTVTLLITVEETLTDRIPPQAEISDIILDKENKEIEIIGSVTDETELGGYELLMYSSEDERIKTSVATGTTAVINELIGTISTENLESGTYLLELKAWDIEGNTCISGASFVYTKGTDETGDNEEVGRDDDTTPPVIAGELKAAITESGLNLTLFGTIHDENLKEYTVITGRVYENTISAPVTIAYGTENITDGTIAEYTYESFGEGDYAVRVIAEDNAGNKRTVTYTVTITKQGTIDDGYHGENGDDTGDEDTGLNLVLSKTIANLGETVKAYMTYPKNATDVTLTAEGAGVTVYGRNADITANLAGEVEVVLSAVIEGERKTVSQKIRIFDTSDRIHPVAYFLTPENDSVLKEKTEITGTAMDETSMAYYILEYRMEGTDEYRQIAYGTEPVMDDVLGELDTTMLENGRYLLRLTVVDNGGNRIRVERSINVEGNLKIGNFNLSFTDISANVSGIPLTVTRSYDSRNKLSGDFGTGWKLGMQSVKLIESSDITQGYRMIQQGTQFSTGYYMTQTQCHDITVTYGDGTSDRFELKLTPERQGLIPIYEVQITFLCVTDKNVKLELNGDNHALVYGNQLLPEDDRMFDARSYVLTKKDGTKLYLDNEHGLLKMEDTNGNTVSISKNGFKHSDGNGVTFTRDSRGHVIKAVEKGSAGNVISSMTYAYDSKDNLIAVTDDSGRTVTFTYDDDHNLIDIIDPSGMAVARNEYDDAGRLIATIDAEGNRVEYEHDIDGRTETVRDKMGNVTVYTYDDNGNILQTVDALGNVTSSTYDENNNVLTKTDAKGNVTTYNYDSDNNLKSLTSADGVTEKIEYNTLNLVNSISFADSCVMTMDYDSKGNLTEMKDSLGNETELSYAQGGKLTGITDSIGTVQTLTYDSDGNLTVMTDGNGNTTSYTYDSEGKCSGVTVKRTEPDGTVKEYTSIYSYDNAGNITAVISNTGEVTSYEYDFRNNRTAAIAPDGKRTEYTYDSQDNLIMAAYPDGTTEHFTYDLNGNNTSATSRMGITVTMTYDKLNRLLKKIYANGTEESYSYDENGNVITYVSVTGGVTAYTYDSMNRNTSITDAYGNVTTFEYNESSLLTKTVDALGNEFAYVYDANGNQTEVIYPDGTSEKTEYDARGRVTKLTDRNGNSTEYTYDNADNLTSVKDAIGGIYTYEYDETYELIKVIDANGNETCYEYDGEGRLIKTINSAGNAAEFEYDANGYNVGYKDYAGNSTEYLYDENGRIAKCSNKDGDTVYTYDELGRLVTVTDFMGVIRFAYDEYSRLASKTTYDYGTIKYTYNGSNEVSSITININGVDIGTTSYEYDLMNRVVRVVGHDGCATLYEYDALGNRTAVRHEGGLTVSYKYDECSRLINEIVTDKDSNVIMYYGYRYGNAGEKTQAVEVVRESAADSYARVICTSYEYDNLLRLTDETISIAGNVEFDRIISGTEDSSRNWNFDIQSIFWSGNVRNQYTYDAVGNRTARVTTVTGDVCGLDESVETGESVYTYNELNQLIKVHSNGALKTYTYDVNGNLVSEHGGSEDKTYTYNAENKLITATVSSGNNVTIESYAYDYAGNRVSKQTNEEDRIYYLNDTFEELTQVALELRKSETGFYNVDKYYTRGTELISVDISDDTNIYKKKLYLMDGHGSVTALAENRVSADDTIPNSITDTYVYDAYGNLLKQTGMTDNDYLYTGEQYNVSTGLYYLRARYMNPETGTFTSMDSYAGTLDNPVSLHKYLYANANPVMYTDPSGYFSLMETSVAQSIQSTLNSVIVPYFNIQKLMSWANLAVTMYDVAQQFHLLLSGEANFFGLVTAIAKGMITQALLNCALTAVLGEAATMVLKIIGVAQNAGSFVEAVKSGDPEKIIVETIRLVVSLYTLKSQCFTGETLVSTTAGDKRIDEIEAGDYVWSYDTETGEKAAAKVTDVSVTETGVLVHVITSEGDDIETTMFHPFYVKCIEKETEENYNGEWKAASNLVAGDELQSEEDGRIVYVKEVRIERLAESIQVYNLEIEGLHTYYVGSGVLVHNRCKLGENMKKEKPFGIEDPGDGYDAHHIFPQKFRGFFEALGIDIDAAEYGIWLPESEHRSGSYAYNLQWERQIKAWEESENYSIEDIFNFLNSLDRLW